MKKTFAIVLALVLGFALAAPASAATIPSGEITLTVQAVDYVSALAGIAKPTDAAHDENERFAALVAINVPTWYDTTNMSVVIEKTGLSIDSAIPISVATGNYLIFGTLYSTAGRMKITIQDNAIGSASTAQELWAALYGDRTVSATLDFASAAATVQQAGINTTRVVEIPATGDKPAAFAALFCITAAVIIAALASRRRYHLNA